MTGPADYRSMSEAALAEWHQHTLEIDMLRKELTRLTLHAADVQHQRDAAQVALDEAHQHYGTVVTNQATELIRLKDRSYLLAMFAADLHHALSALHIAGQLVVLPAPDSLNARIWSAAMGAAVNSIDRFRKGPPPEDFPAEAENEARI